MKRTNHSKRSAVEILEARRLLSAGALDPSFSGDGRAKLTFGASISDLVAMDVAVQGDGKSVVVGYETVSGAKRMVVARFNFDGSLDSTFHPGHTVFDFKFSGDEIESTARAVAIQGDGKILIAGYTTHEGIILDDSDFAIVRLNPNGSLDSTFHGDGRRTVSIGDGDDAKAITVQKDGKIVIVGETMHGIRSQYDSAVIRLNPNGSLDSSFRSGGAIALDIGPNSFPNAVAIDQAGDSSSNPNFGKIVIAGTADDDGADKQFVARLNRNGTVDTSFSGDGIVMDVISGDLHSEGKDVIIQPRSKIVIASRTRVNSMQPGRLALTRYRADGTRDNGFGNSGNGSIITGFSGNAVPSSIAVNSMGQLIVAGTVGTHIFGIARYSANGIADTSFSSDGKDEISSTESVNPKDNTLGTLAQMTYGPGSRFTIAGGSHFNTMRLLDSGARQVSATTILNTASETGPTPVSFLVTRSERLPVPTRVFFDVGGTATTPTLFALRAHTNDYTVDGLTFPLAVLGGSTVPFVDIPANATFKIVTLMPIVDTRTEGNETATFSIRTDASYDAMPPTGLTITIRDSGSTTGTTLNASADAFVRDGADAGKNFGTGTELDVKKSGSGFNRRAYVKFDISSLTNVNSVKLKVFGSLTNTNQPTVAADIFAVADTSWTEGGINFNNKPAQGSTALGRLTVSGTTASFYEIDVTSYVNAQKAAGKTAVSFALIGVADSDPFIKLNSREAGNGPTLVVS